MRRLTPGILLLTVLGCTPAAAPPAGTATAPVADPAEAETLPPRVAEPEQPFELEAGFRLLTLADFDAFDSRGRFNPLTGLPVDLVDNQHIDSQWQATDDGFRCTGKPRGYIYSKDTFQNFTCRVSYRFPRPDILKDESKFKGNTGFLVYISGEPKLWPVCLEVQGKFVQMGAIKENGGAQPPEVIDDEAARQQARKPVGEWNDLEIMSRDGTLTVNLNGTQVAHSQPAFLSGGALGVQSEDHPFEVRRMRVRVDEIK